MANMVTTLRDYANNGNSRTYVTSAHTAAAPRLVIQKRKIASTPTGVAQDDISVLFGFVDANGAPVASKIAFSVNFRRPLNCDPTAQAGALALFREVVASDNFADVVNAQNWVQ